MTTTPAAPPRVDVTQFAGKDTMIRLVRQEYQACFDMLVAASEQEWHAQTPCDMWEVRDLAGHLLDAAYCYLGYVKQSEHGWPTEEPRGMRPYADALGRSAREYRSTYRWEVLGRLEACTELLLRYFDRLTEDEWAGRMVPHRWLGPVPAFMMAALALMDYSVHNWDLRTALGKDAFVDHEASDTLVPFMFGLMQVCFLSERADGLDLTVDVQISTSDDEHWTVRIVDKTITFTPGAAEQPDATFAFPCYEFCLDVYQRLRGGITSGDQDAVDTFRKLFFTI